MLQQSKKRTLCVEIALIEIYVFTDIGSGKYTHTQHDSVEVRLGPVFISQQQQVSTLRTSHTTKSVPENFTRFYMT